MYILIDVVTICKTIFDNFIYSKFNGDRNGLTQRGLTGGVTDVIRFVLNGSNIVANSIQNLIMLLD